MKTQKPTGTTRRNMIDLLACLWILRPLIGEASFNNGDKGVTIIANEAKKRHDV